MWSHTDTELFHTYKTYALKNHRLFSEYKRQLDAVVKHAKPLLVTVADCEKAASRAKAFYNFAEEFNNDLMAIASTIKKSTRVLTKICPVCKDPHCAGAYE